MNDDGSMVKAVYALQSFRESEKWRPGKTDTQCTMNWDPKSRCSPVCRALPSTSDSKPQNTHPYEITHMCQCLT